MWLEYKSLPDSPLLYLDVTWVDKTATRLPEVLHAFKSTICMWLQPAMARFVMKSNLVQASTSRSPVARNNLCH